MYGLTEEQARDQKAETVVGRLRLRGKIYESEWEAAQRFAKDAQTYAQALQAPRGLGVPDSGPPAAQDERYARFVAQHSPMVGGMLLADIAMYAAEEGDIVEATALLNEANKIRSKALEEKWSSGGGGPIPLPKP